MNKYDKEKEDMENFIRDFETQYGPVSHYVRVALEKGFSVGWKNGYAFGHSQAMLHEINSMRTFLGLAPLT